MTIRLYDISGQLIRELVNQYHEAGQYKAFWDGRDSAGAEASSGVYLLRLASGGYNETVDEIGLLAGYFGRIIRRYTASG